MADRVLPSPGVVSSWLHDPDASVGVPGFIFDVLEARASGRLVDREAIDHEAIHEHLLDFILIQSLEDPGLSLNDVRRAVTLGIGETDG